METVCRTLWLMILGEMSLYKAIEVGDYSEYGNTINAFIETAAIVSVYKMAQHYPYNVFRQKPKERWSQIEMQIDKNVPIDTVHQSRSIRLYGTLFKTNLWSLAWVLGRVRGRCPKTLACCFCSTKKIRSNEQKDQCYYSGLQC